MNQAYRPVSAHVFPACKSSLRPKFADSSIGDSTCQTFASPQLTGSRKDRHTVKLSLDRDVAYESASTILFNQVSESSRQHNAIASYRIKKLKKKYTSQVELRKAVKLHCANRSNHRMDGRRADYSSKPVSNTGRSLNLNLNDGRVYSGKSARDPAEQSTVDEQD